VFYFGALFGALWRSSGVANISFSNILKPILVISTKNAWSAQAGPQIAQDGV
jgi:hypothetical protein